MRCTSPLGIVLAIRLVPPEILTECRGRAHEAAAHGKPASRIAAAVIYLLIVVAAASFALLGYSGPARWPFQA